MSRTKKKAGRRRIDALELWCWRRLLRVHKCTGVRAAWGPGDTGLVTLRPCDPGPLAQAPLYCPGRRTNLSAVRIPRAPRGPPAPPLGQMRLWVEEGHGRRLPVCRQEAGQWGGSALGDYSADFPVSVLGRAGAGCLLFGKPLVPIAFWQLQPLRPRVIRPGRAWPDTEAGRVFRAGGSRPCSAATPVRLLWSRPAPGSPSDALQTHSALVRGTANESFSTGRN